MIFKMKMNTELRQTETDEITELLPEIREFFPEAKIETSVPTSHLSRAQKFMENTPESVVQEHFFIPLFVIFGASIRS